MPREPIDRAARKHDRIHRIDKTGRVEQVRLARARRAAAHIATGNRARVRQDHRHARSYIFVMCITDANTINIGNEIARPLANGANGHKLLPE